MLWRPPAGRRKTARARINMPLASISQREQREHVHAGYCAATLGAEGRQCLPSDTQGSWKVQRERACVRLCNNCAQCQYISFSEKLMDCSWFSSCNMSQLRKDFSTGHETQHVKRKSAGRTRFSCAAYDRLGHWRPSSIAEQFGSWRCPLWEDDHVRFNCSSFPFRRYAVKGCSPPSALGLLSSGHRVLFFIGDSLTLQAPPRPADPAVIHRPTHTLQRT